MNSLFWDKKIKCPFCDFEFETTRLRASAIHVKEKYSDFGCVYEGPSAYLYAITACPQCTLAARNEEFEKFRPDYEPRLMELSRRMTAMKDKPDIFKTGDIDVETAVRRHEHALKLHPYRAHADPGEKAGLLMHIVWIRRMTGEVEKEHEAMRRAITAYEEFYEKGNKLPEKLGEPGVLFLIGELYRRLGDFRQSRLTFSRALESKELSAFPSIEHMIRDTMLVAKEQMEKSGQ
jgi:uncharacterized protein